MGANNRESDDTNGYNPLQKLQYESELKRLDVGMVNMESKKCISNDPQT